ncbi:MAG TPA: ribosome small subunit-dependent GTPase A [Casimicrobiaceae bacterium]|nr:ribosome small subunit-dependent GTPase A [Casimicrobiaceae bacterium]
MLELDIDALSALGLTPALAARAAAIEMQPTDGDAAYELARVVEVHRETIDVHDGCCERRARMLPRLVRSLNDEGSALAVGDWVIVSRGATRERWLMARVPPSSHISRRDGDGRVHPIVSNVDVALLVMGLDNDFNPRRLERYLVLVHGQGIVPVVVLTKLDIALADARLLDERMATLRKRVPSHIDICSVDATNASAAGVLRPYCEGNRTLVLLGSSGAGKSTLTNTLLGASIQDTGAVRENDGRGKHTTTSRSLHRLPGGASIIDTPGLRTLRLDGDQAMLEAGFADIATLARRCRFADCAHEHEPGCAVRASIDADRLQNFKKLEREARRDTLTALDRKRQLAQWKVRSRAAREHLRRKRGEG